MNYEKIENAITEVRSRLHRVMSETSAEDHATKNLLTIAYQTLECARERVLELKKIKEQEKRRRDR